MNYKKSSKNL